MESEHSQTYPRSEYAQKEFWNARFREYSKPFDWYATWKELRKYILPKFHPSHVSHVLMVGCGNSSKNYIELSEEMQRDGYWITNIDISDVVIQQVVQKSNQDFLVMNATQTCFRDKTFDLVLDKGTFDALACNLESDLPDLLVQEMGRISNKYVIIVTHGKPDNRSPRFMNSLKITGNWDEQVINCELSVQTQMINIARSKYPDRSLASILKDSTCLSEVLKDLIQYMKSKNSSNESGLRQSHCFLYFYTKLEA